MRDTGRLAPQDRDSSEYERRICELQIKLYILEIKHERGRMTCEIKQSVLLLAIPQMGTEFGILDQDLGFDQPINGEFNSETALILVELQHMMNPNYSPEGAIANIRTFVVDLKTLTTGATDIETKITWRAWQYCASMDHTMVSGSLFRSDPDKEQDLW